MVRSLDVEIQWAEQQTFSHLPRSSSALSEERNFVRQKQSKDSTVMREHEEGLVRVTLSPLVSTLTIIREQMTQFMILLAQQFFISVKCVEQTCAIPSRRFNINDHLRDLGIDERIIKKWNRV
jgi:hypothetical protein